MVGYPTSSVAPRFTLYIYTYISNYRDLVPLCRVLVTQKLAFDPPPLDMRFSGL